MLFIEPIRRKENCNRLANHFFRLVSKDALRAGVPRADDSVEVLGQHGVCGKLDNGRQASARLLGETLYSRVPKDEYNAEKRMTFAMDRSGAVVD